jgi:two-component system, NarL family, sensor histidine kinase DesK
MRLLTDLVLAGPLADLFGRSMSAAHVALLLAGLTLFAIVYMSLLPPSGSLQALHPRAVLVALAVLPVIAIALLVGGAPVSFAALFVYFVAAAGILMPPGVAALVVALTAGGVAIGGAATNQSGASVGALVLTIVAIGAMMGAFGRLARANDELRRTREELAGLAVAEERLRIARDLHDLLGHSLSVVALKSEVARRLVEREPKRAATELDDIQAVTREALAEVRDAVQGYRRLALSDALSGARTSLTSAGIDCKIEAGDPPVPPDVDAVLAWAVREGTTNVIRHSGAHRCTIRVETAADRAALEIEDDGPVRPVGTGAGTGLDGLRERVRRVRGELEAGTRAEGGFRLRLTIPLARP